MLGKFQSSQLRIEIKASEKILAQSLLNTEELSKWFFPLKLEKKISKNLTTGIKFKSYVGFVEINHEVQSIENNCLRLILSKGIDGYQEWCWGDGWVQSTLEGVSLLPLNLGQTLNLLRFREYVAMKLKSSENSNKNN